MTKKNSWLKKDSVKKGSISTSMKRLNSSLGEYLMAIKSLNNSLEGTTKTR